jgi:hypothetical protein
MNGSPASLQDLFNFAELDGVERAECLRRTAWVLQATDDQLCELLQGLLEAGPPSADAAEEQFLEALLAKMVQRFATAFPQGQADSETNVDAQIVALYRKLGQKSNVRHYLLLALVQELSYDHLRQFSELVSTDPPLLSTHAAAPFFPLFRTQDFDVTALFPILFEGLAHVQVATPILDLANYVTRSEMVTRHPASDLSETLIELLGNVTGRLGRLESLSTVDAASWDKARDQVNDGVALAVSLCDALGLMGDSAAVGKLFQALELGHRRVCTEAAAALVRLGEKAGKKTLASLVTEPVARLRVLSYAEELQFLDEIKDEFKSTVARAEAELACCLAESTHFGLAPSHVEAVHQQTQYWPGYDEPVECFLFRYTYEFPNGTFSNIGISGPLVHALTCSLEDLPPDDIYSAYAGWQAEHKEIFELEIKRLDDRQRSDVQFLEQKLGVEGFRDIESAALGFFFGEIALIATAHREDVVGSVIADMQEIFWYPAVKRPGPIRPEDAYSIYKGRKLLQQFNP